MEKASIIVRLPHSLHRRLKTAAQAAHCSLNRYCTMLLSQGHGGSASAAPSGALLGPPPEFSDLVQPICGWFAAELEGIVLFGSTARGTATPSADIDLLIVLSPATVIERDSYARLRPLRYDGREVAPLLVLLPDAREEIRGIWLEIALDGIVLFDRRLMVNRYLAKVRGVIAAGDVKRLTTHGHPYWVHVRADEAPGAAVS